MILICIVFMINEKLNKDILDLINGIKGNILWQNNNPTDAFQEQIIRLSSNEYDMYEVLFYGSNTKADLLTSGRIPKSENAFLQQIYNIGSGAKVRNRSVKYIDGTHFKITGATLDGNENNFQNIPVYIIGYKTHSNF